MDLLPLETVVEIGILLSTKDVCSFRLTCCYFAQAAFPIISRHLSLIDTSTCLAEFLHYLKANPHISVETLTIYHGKWPICSRKEWLAHPLLCYEQYPCMTRQNGSRPFDTTRAMEAYGKYRNFLAAEDRRNQSTDVIVMTNILRLLPNLKAITVRNLQPWGQTPLTSAKVSNLRKAIWISPSFGGSLHGVMVWLLKSIVGHPSLNSIAVRGRVLSSTLCGYQLPRIVTLRLTAVILTRAGSWDDPTKDAWAFLQVFPNLRTLELRLSITDSSTKPLERIQLPHLVHLSLEGVQANGHLLANTLGQRRLCSLTMKDVTLLDGDWASTIKGFTQHPSIGMLDASESACIRLAVTQGARNLLDSVVTKPGTE